MVLHTASLFSGVGGLDLGLKLAIPESKTVLYIERDSYAAATLVARMEDKTLDQAPICADITTFDGRAWCGKVDILVGGFPCQDISVAGKGVGIGGKRSGLWSEIVRLADEIRPRYLFLENVSAITSRGLDVVLADLAELGFDAEWLCLRASDVGAPHRRERWFCLGYAKGRHGATDERSLRQREREYRGIRGVAHTERARWDETDRRELYAGRQSVTGCGEMDDANDARLQGRQRPKRQGADKWTAREAGGAIFPPGPGDLDAWRDIPSHLAPAVEPGLRVLVDGTPLVVDESRADQLRCCGNGVVPLRAAVAFRILLERSMT